MPGLSRWHLFRLKLGLGLGLDTKLALARAQMRSEIIDLGCAFEQRSAGLAGRQVVHAANPR
jgi:hypothetical protein